MLTSLMQIVKNAKVAVANGSRPLSLREEPLGEQFPWSSPNIWQRVVDFYGQLEQPVIFEYGSGISSIWHIRNLMKSGGHYVSVEHESEWYYQVLREIVDLVAMQGVSFKLESKVIEPTRQNPIRRCDTSIHFANADSHACSIKLKLRPAISRTDPNDGILTEFENYVHAVSEPCDVVVVDGRARKACVTHVLATDYLRPGGLLALFEAGRGVDGWLGRPKVEGTSDYQPVVKKMIALGAELVDGSGFASWPCYHGPLTNAVNGYDYPLEACFLTRTSSDAAKPSPAKPLEIPRGEVSTQS